VASGVHEVPDLGVVKIIELMEKASCKPFDIWLV